LCYSQRTGRHVTFSTLGGWDASQGAIVIDKDNNEHTLQPGEVVDLKPAMRFSKKVRWRRIRIVTDHGRVLMDAANDKYLDHLNQKAEKNEKKRRKREEEKLAERMAIREALVGLEFS
jgi:hypothetical protein